MEKNSKTIIGVDPGSHYAGIAVMRDNELLFSQQVVSLPDGKWIDDELAAHMCSFMLEVQDAIDEYDAELLVVELTSVPTNMHTNKILSYFEAAAITAASMSGISILRARTSEARKSVLGKGNIKKDEAVEKIKDQYGSDLSDDEAEAIMFAIHGRKQDEEKE